MATSGKCPKCEWKTKKIPKDSPSYYYHYGSHGTFDTFRSGVRHILEWCSKDSRSLCRTVDRAEIQRLMEEVRRDANILNS